jgi:signal transduction histidine kinase
MSPDETCRGMRRPCASVRVALAVCVLVLVLVTAGATAAGYLVEAHGQSSEQARRLSAAAAYVSRYAARAGTPRWQQALTSRLTALGLRAQLTVVGLGGKRVVYASTGLVARTPPAGRPARAASAAALATPGAARPTATYLFPLAVGPGTTLTLDLYAPSPDPARPVLVALASGLAVLLAGAMLLIWAVSRWLVTPLRRLSTQVDAIAGGDPLEAREASPIREVENVAAAVAGMATRLAQTAEHDARLEAERRLLVSSIAHDLRTPLFSLRGYLDAIASGLGNPAKRLDRARAKAEQIDRLVSGLFDYARADIDERPRLHSADLAEAVIDAAAAFELAAGERGVRLQVTAHARPSVMIDRDGFDRALANVLDNALRHTPRGGTVDVACGEDAPGQAVVRVTDDGPGIASDVLSGLFELTARPARGSHTGGAGLGLTIAARLLRSQGGTIEAANAPPRGAVLTIRLPRQAA